MYVATSFSFSMIIYTTDLEIVDGLFCKECRLCNTNAPNDFAGTVQFLAASELSINPIES